MADGGLTAGAIQLLPLPVDHVTLSGCGTGAATRSALDVAAGALAGLAYAAVIAIITMRPIGRIQREWHPRFPGPAADAD